ncbi:hypothetical protein ACLKA6_014770 [Drosophila palustris]
MLSRERLGNPNQRLIPLTPELIQDMLEHESLEYQTPPGGHRRSSTNQKIADKLRRNQISYTKKQEKINRKSMKKIDFKAEKSREKEKCLDAFLESVLMKSLDRFNDKPKAQTISMELQYIKSPTRRLYCTSSSANSMSTQSGQTKEELQDFGMYNYYAMQQCWINAFLMPKSRTSFFLNRHKLPNFRNHFKAKTKDSCANYDAFAALKSRYKWNFRNAVC